MYTVIDFETTGLNYKIDEVIEIAAIKLNKKFEQVGELHLYCSTNLKVSKFITDLTGLNNVFLAENGIEPWDGMSILDKFIDDSIVVAQHAPFDLSFLELVEGYYNFYCTRSMLLAEYPTESSSLKPSCDRLGIKLENAHTALNDVKATAELFKYLMTEHHCWSMKNKLVINDRTLNYIPHLTDEIKHVNDQVIYQNFRGE